MWGAATATTIGRKLVFSNSTYAPTILTDLNTPWEQVFHLGTPVSFKAKTILSARTADIEKAGLFYIKRGRIKLSHIAPNGQEKIMIYMGKGMLFNEIPMLLPFSDALFTVMEPTDAVFFPKKRLTLDFIKQYPHVILNMLESVSKKSQIFYTQLCTLRSFGTFANVCRALYSMHLYNREGQKIVPRLTQQELAALLGVHRSSLHKALFRLQSEGIIGTYSRKELPLYNEKVLKEYAEEPEDF